MEAGIVTAAKDACELCGARASIQAKYLEQLTGSLGETHTIVRLPLLPKEVRGGDNIASFSNHMIVTNVKLLDEATSDLGNKATDDDIDMLSKLNALLSAAPKPVVAVETSKETKKETTASTTPEVNPMMLLMRLQGRYSSRWSGTRMEHCGFDFYSSFLLQTCFIAIVTYLLLF